jgi:WD40 repeat protein
VNAKIIFLAGLGISLCVAGSLIEARDPPITSIAFAPDGKTVAACSQSGLRLYSWPGLKPGKKLETSALNLHDLAFSPSGDRLAVGGGIPADEGTVEIFSWPGGKPLQVLNDHKDSVMGIAWLSGSSIASGSLDHSVVLWDTTTGSLLKRLKGHSRGVSSLCFLEKKKLLVSAGIDQSLRVWNLETGKLVHSLDNHTLPVHGIALRPGSGGLPMIASVSDDRTVRLWQPTIGRMVRFARLDTKPLDVGWLPDGSRIVAACTDGNLRLVDPLEVKVTRTLPAGPGWTYSLAVHPLDGSVAAGGSDGRIRRISIATAKR